MLDQPDDANVIDLVPDAGWSDGAARSCGAPGARVTSHGKATCRWSLGQTAAVDGALFPDGTRGRAEDVEMFSAGKGWRRPDGAGGWIFGTVALRDDDAVFADAPVQPHADWRRLDGNPDMGADLAAGRVLAGPAGAGFAQPVALFLAGGGRAGRGPQRSRRNLPGLLLLGDWHRSRHAGGHRAG